MMRRLIMMNEPKINEDTLKLIEARVLWAERTNLDTNERNDSDMADRIIEIIKEETECYLNK